MEEPMYIENYGPTTTLSFDETVFAREFIIFLIIFGIVLYFLEKLLRKWLRIEKKKGFDTPGKGLEVAGIVIIGIIGLIFISVLITRYGLVSNWILAIYSIGMFALMQEYQAFIQWKYWDTKEYVITLIFLAICVFAVAFISFSMI